MANYEVALMVGSALTAFILIYGSIHIDKKHGMLQTLFMFMGLAVILNTMGMGHDIAVNSGASATFTNMTSNAVELTTWTLYGSLAYYIVMLFIWALEFLGFMSGAKKSI